MDNPYTRGLASYISSESFERIPTKVIERAKLLILDGLGCGLYGSSQEWTQILSQTLQEIDASREAVLWGTPTRLGVVHAALVNSTAVQGFELDDVHIPGVLHAESLTIPAALALSEWRPGVSGREFLTAVVVGFETGARVGMCMRGGEMLRRGWHSGAIFGSFAAAATSASLLGLDTEGAVHALGIAGSQASGLMAAQYGAMVKRMQHGRACQSGVYAGLLAARGFTGIEDVFESRYGGYCTTFTQSEGEFDLDRLVADLSKDYETLRVRSKLYPCMGGGHGPVQTILDLSKEHGFSALDIDQIDVTGGKTFVEHGGWAYEGRSITEAQMNVPYCVAAAIWDGDLTIDRFKEDSISDEGIVSLARRIRVHHDPEVDARRAQGQMRVHLRNGHTLVSPVHRAKGLGSEPEDYPTVDVLEKFRNLASRILRREDVRRVEEIVMDLESVDDAAVLAAALVGN
jgi:aconitate decarboxylase